MFQGPINLYDFCRCTPQNARIGRSGSMALGGQGITDLSFSAGFLITGDYEAQGGLSSLRFG